MSAVIVATAVLLIALSNLMAIIAARHARDEARQRCAYLYDGISSVRDRQELILEKLKRIEAVVVGDQGDVK